jgi:Skp family chaperone for outer membrane proteins
MKRIIVTGSASVFFAIAAISAVGQTPRPSVTPLPRATTAAPPTVRAATATVPDTKIALVDTTQFGDEKAGITRYVNAVKAVQREFLPRNTELLNLQNRIKAIADEITKLRGNPVVDPSSVQLKQDDGERLQRELKYKKEQADADFEKRYTEVVGPVSTAIGKALDQYAAQHSLTMILDISKLLPAVLTVNPAMDVTQAFITEYNSKNP